jgi:hypothetical protein
MTVATWKRQTAIACLPACRQVNAQAQARRIYSTLPNSVFSIAPVIDWRFRSISAEPDHSPEKTMKQIFCHERYIDHAFATVNQPSHVRGEG